ncbi:ABZJ_00895 family protein [Mesorhizobium opportunistum]|uniref:ABZJ_00895 family protein n=1 Tax=Mesorhizobium opportunistum TaxID=593909 RepID=UPI00059B3C5B|nr:ABZJ_00895 family protein [Mesorhizobium opportunistum]
MNFASTLTAYSLFIRKHGRTFHRGEYWKTVVFSTIAIILFSMFFLLLSLADDATAAKLRGIPFGGWVAIMALATLFAFCLNAFGYSSWFGNRMLKANRKRQTQLDTKPFR